MNNKWLIRSVFFSFPISFQILLFIYSHSQLLLELLSPPPTRGTISDKMPCLRNPSLYISAVTNRCISSFVRIHHSLESIRFRFFGDHLDQCTCTIFTGVCLVAMAFDDSIHSISFTQAFVASTAGISCFVNRYTHIMVYTKATHGFNDHRGLRRARNLAHAVA